MNSIKKSKKNRGKLLKRIYKHPLVSVLISTKNQGKYVERTIRSILQQDYSRMKILVTDGGSTDDTIDILKRFSKSIFWQSTPDEGEYDGYNKLLQNVRKDFIKIVPSDDMLLPNAISRCTEFILKNPDIDIVYGFSYIIDTKGRTIGVQGPQWKNRPVTLKNYLRSKVNHNFQTALIRRTVFNRVGLFNSDKFKYIGDFEFFARCLKAGLKIAYIPEFLGAWRLTYENQSHTHGKLPYKQALTVVKKYGGEKELIIRITRDILIHKILGIFRKFLGRIKWTILERFGYSRENKYKSNKYFC